MRKHIERDKHGNEIFPKYAFRPYPKCLYHQEKGDFTVESKEEHEALGPDWYESPEDFPKVEEKPAVKPVELMAVEPEVKPVEKKAKKKAKKKKKKVSKKTK